MLPCWDDTAHTLYVRGACAKNECMCVCVCSFTMFLLCSFLDYKHASTIGVVVVVWSMLGNRASTMHGANTNNIRGSFTRVCEMRAHGLFNEANATKISVLVSAALTGLLYARVCAALYTH